METMIDFQEPSQLLQPKSSVPVIFIREVLQQGAVNLIYSVYNVSPNNTAHVMIKTINKQTETVLEKYISLHFRFQFQNLRHGGFFV